MSALFKLSMFIRVSRDFTPDSADSRRVGYYSREGIYFIYRNFHLKEGGEKTNPVLQETELTQTEHIVFIFLQRKHRNQLC